MPINFPSTPSTNDLYTFADRTYRYDGEKWVARHNTPEPTKGTNAVLRTNAGNIIEDVTVSDHSTTFTADAGANTLSVGTNSGFANGDIVYVSTTTTLPAGLSALTPYYVVGAAAATMQLALTFGGSAIDITSTGTGTHTVYQAINGSSIGPLLIEDGFTVTVPYGSTWEII